MAITRHRLHEIVFEADTKAGKTFDIWLLIAIFLSVIAAMLESVPGFSQKYSSIFYYLEWFFTILFTIEYALRIYLVNIPKNYIFSFYGLIDLLAILPTYLSLLLPGTQSLIVIRSIRLLRMFRVLKILKYFRESLVLVTALRESRVKITVFLIGALVSVIIIGALMYLIEGPENGFTSVPRATYWAIVTVTTVGYGDIVPNTPLGQFLSAFLMFVGYGMIAVPTGIVSVEISKASQFLTTQVCPDCNKEGHACDAVYCKFCSAQLN